MISQVNGSEILPVTLKDTRGWGHYLISVVQSLYKECISRLNRSNNPFNKSSFPGLRLNGTYTEQKWAPTSKRLVVLVHGLNSSPLCWSRYFTNNPSTSYFVPHVFRKGYCKVEDAAFPILNVIQDYVRNHPNNPIYIVGHSFGATIAQEVESGLHAKSIHFISIAGPHRGSKLVNWLEWFGLKSSPVPRYDGEEALAKLSAWQKLSRSNVKRTFYATADDLRIFPNDTSFPAFPNSTYHLLSGESHVTIIDAVAGQILKEIGI